MEFVKFQVKRIQINAFEQAFLSILKESKISCSQWEFQHGDSYSIAEIPKYAIDKMTTEQIDILKSFK